MKLSLIAKKSALARGGIVASCERILSELNVEIDPRILKELRNPRGKGPTKIANELDAMQRFVGAVEIALCGPVPMEASSEIAPAGGEDIMDLGDDTEPTNLAGKESTEELLDDAPEALSEDEVKDRVNAELQTQGDTESADTDEEEDAGDEDSSESAEGDKPAADSNAAPARNKKKKK